MMRRWCPTLMLIALSMVATGRATGQNLLTNPEFASSLTGWTAAGAGTATFTSAAGSPDLGAASLTALSAGPTGAVATMTFSQCVALSVPGPYQATLRSYIGSGVQVLSRQVQFFTTVGCAGSPSGLVDVGLNYTFLPGVPGNFAESNVTGISAPGGSQSAALVVTVEPAGGAFQLYVDHAFFGPPVAPVTVQTFTAE